MFFIYVTSVITALVLGILVFTTDLFLVSRALVGIFRNLRENGSTIFVVILKGNLMEVHHGVMSTTKEGKNIVKYQSVQQFLMVRM